MKVLAWYTAVFNGLIIIALILVAVEVIPRPPFTPFENIFWAAVLLPVLVFGIRVIREPR